MKKTTPGGVDFDPGGVEFDPWGVGLDPGEVDLHPGGWGVPNWKFMEFPSSGIGSPGIEVHPSKPDGMVHTRPFNFPSTGGCPPRGYAHGH